MNIRLRSRFFSTLLLLCCALLASGCLTAERKEIVFTVKPDGSGTGRITFYNIKSIEEEGKDNSSHDYADLVKKYLKGTKFEESYPEYLNMKKRLYEEEGRLNGELTFEFKHYEDIGLYRYEGKGPWMYFIGSRSDVAIERFDTSNGSYPNDMLPVVFWPAEISEFHIIDRFDDPGQAARSLLPLFKRFGTE
jgi:hypothetical protein